MKVQSSGILQPQIPCYIEVLPDEILLKIFEKVTKQPSAWVSLSLVSHRFRLLVFDPYIYKGMEDVLPSYLKLDSDRAVRKLPTWKRVVLADTIQRNLLKDTLKPLIVINNRCSQKFVARIIFDNHFIIQTESSINIYDLKTKKRTTISGKDINKGFLGVYADKPLLIGFQTGKVQIWDFNRLKKDEPESFVKNIFEASELFGLMLENTQSMDPIACSFNHLLAIAFRNHVMILDCNNGSEWTIPFQDANQVEFTDTHLMLVSPKNIQVFETSTLLGKKESEEIKPLYSFKNKKIHLAKIKEDRIVVFHEEIAKEDSFIVGRLIHWKKESPTVINLVYSKQQALDFERRLNVCSFDWYREQIYAVSHLYIHRWSLNQSTMDKCNKDSKFSSVADSSMSVKHLKEDLFFSVQGTGGYMLGFALSHLAIIDKNFKKVKIHKDKHCVYKLQGRFLLKEKATCNFKPFETPVSTKVIVYNLGIDSDANSEIRNARSNPLLFGNVSK